MLKTPSAQSLKIGLVLDTSLDPPDGVQQYVTSVGEWLRTQGHDVHYLVGETRQKNLPNIHSLTRNFQVSFNGNRTTVPLFISRHAARKFIQSEQFDVLHVQTPHHPFMSQRLICAAPSSTAVIATFHILPYGILAKIATRLLKILLHPSLKRLDSMLAVSPAAAVFEEEVFGLPAKVLPNVIDVPRFQNAQPFAKDTAALTILFLGRLVERKGCHVLLQAVAELYHSVGFETLPKFKVVICGKGHLDAALKEYVQAQGLNDIVSFAGFVSEEDKPGYYASADISVFPSSSGESFGIVLLEAMASGAAAVIAGDNPGYRTVMEPHSESLFPPLDSHALAEKLQKLLTDAAARKQSADWGKTYAEHFDVSIVGAKLLNEYNQVLRSRRSVQ